LKISTGSGVSETTAHVEHENFLRAIVNATPLAVVKPGSSWSDSTLSLDSLYSPSSAAHHTHHHAHLSVANEMYAPQVTPDSGRKGNPFMKGFINTLRYAG